MEEIKGLFQQCSSCPVLRLSTVLVVVLILLAVGDRAFSIIEKFYK